MKIKVKQNIIVLDKATFLSKGGQGFVYGKDDLVYKIYINSKNMIVEKKIEELKKIKNKNVLIPIDIIFNTKNKPIGITMTRIKNSIPLCKLFTNDYRSRNNVKDKEIYQLIENMIKIISVIHKANCLLVDLNEFNFLVDEKNYRIPYFIDVDSYQTKNYPATFIIPTIRDYLTNKFTEMTDWFSFGIIICQLLVGIHPYKGRHPDFKKKDIIQRMKNKISIFNSRVTLPSTVRNFNLIPTNFQEWFIEIFEKGLRKPPPVLLGAIIQEKRKITSIKLDKIFKVQLLREYDSQILFYKYYNGIEIVKIRNNIIYFGRNRLFFTEDWEVLINQKNEFLGIKIIDNNLCTTKRNSTMKSANIYCKDKIIVDNNLFLIGKNNINYTKFFSSIATKDTHFGIKQSWELMPNSHKVLSNLIYQNVLGKVYLLMPVLNENGNSKIYEKFISELDEYKIIEGKYLNKVCMLIGFKNGQYDRITIVFNSAHTLYVIDIESNIDQGFINFINIKDKLFVSIEQDGKLSIFLNEFNNKQKKEIYSNSIKSTMKLYNKGDDVLFADDNKLYTLNMN